MMSTNPQEITKLWLIFSMSLGCWTFIHLFISQKIFKPVKIYIALILVITLSLPFYAYLYLAWNVNADLLLSFAQRKSWLLGPLLVSMAGHILLKRNFSFFIFAGALPLVFVMSYDIFQWKFLPDYLLTLLLFVQMGIYLSYTVFMIHKNKSRLIRLTHGFQSSSYFWLIFLTLGIGCLILFDISIYTLLLIQHSPSFIFLAAVGCAAAVLVCGIALIFILNNENPVNENAYKENLGNENSVELDSPNSTSVFTSDTKKNSGPRAIELSTEAAVALRAALDTLVTRESLHLDEHISLASLADKLKISSHQLSELLNVHMGIGFYDYLNQHRFEEALKLITHLNAQLKMADVAYQAGFNNLNSFYKIFKDKTGLTPHQYRKQHAWQTSTEKQIA